MSALNLVRSLLVALVAAAVTVGASGCGAIGYSAAILDAHEAVAEAREADAHIHAPFEYHYAREHIHKAREEAGYGDYQIAMELARDAAEYGTKARDLSRRRRREVGR